MRYTTKSAKETQRIAAGFAKKIAAKKPGKRAVIIALTGDLGSGKTTFVQGFARALGVRRRTVSPTFTIMRRYVIPKKSRAFRNGFHSLVHVDAYRVHKPAELKIIRFEAWLHDPSAIVLIEWADLIEKKHLRGTHRVRFKHREKSMREVITQKSP
jgi:tRNA threonylcarbamoyladenosine biosynthesis protein TsaE